MSQSYEATGTVKLIEETQSFSSGFKKREFVITTDGDTDYPQDLKFEILKDKVTLLDRLSVGQEVTVTFNLRGNEYNGRYYVNLQCWKLEAGEGFAPNEQPQEQRGGTVDMSDDTDIPFSPVPDSTIF